MSSEQSQHPKIHWDLFVSGLITFVLTLLIFRATPSFWVDQLRWILGIPFVMVLPGYWFVNTLFPARNDLDIVERIGLSMALSVAWITVLALILDRLKFGLFLRPILIGELIFIIVFMGITLFRRTRSSTTLVFIPEVTLPHIWWKAQSKTNRRMYLSLVSILGMALIIMAWVFLAPSPAERMTEFYILGQGGLAEDFPREVVAGESTSTTIGISNKEDEVHNYHIEVWVFDPFDDEKREKVGGTNQFTIPADRTIEFLINWHMPQAGEDQMIEFYLFIEDYPEPYRRLRLWMNVEEGEN
jgi:uncharacterized membrane protein